jgi:hypothetical protein
VDQRRVYSTKVAQRKTPGWLGASELSIDAAGTLRIKLAVIGQGRQIRQTGF